MPIDLGDLTAATLHLLTPSEKVSEYLSDALINIGDALDVVAQAPSDTNWQGYRPRIEQIFEAVNAIAKEFAN